MIFHLILPNGQFGLIFTQFGKNAIKLFNERKDIDLLIVDFKLPDIDGLEVVKAIRKINKNIPIIAQSAHATAEDKKKCLKAGCDFFIPKPIKSAFLLSLVADFFITIKK